MLTTGPVRHDSGPPLALTLVLALLALTGCRSRDNDPGPGGVTVGEARALDDAAMMLESRRPAQPPGQASGTAQQPPPASGRPKADPAKQP